MQENHNKAHFTITDNHRKKVIEDSYKAIVDNRSSSRRKLLALKFLAQFIDDPVHRERFEIIKAKAKDLSVRILVTDILNGKYEAFDTEEEIDTSEEIQEMEAAADKLQLKNNAEIQSMNQMLKYLRVQ